MNRDKFVAKMNTVDSVVDMDWVLGIIRRSVDANLPDGYPRGHRNLIIVMEELSELSQEVSKEIRGFGDRYSLIQEIADVKLAIAYLQDICGISDEEINKGFNVKVQRVEDTLDTYGVQK